MIAKEVLQALARRTRRPGPWLGCFITLAAYLSVQAFSGFLKGLKGILVAEAFFGPASLIWVVTFLSPVPWQWSGRRSRGPGFLRGCLQSLLFCEGSIALLIGVSGLTYLYAHKPFFWLSYALTNLGLCGSLMIVFGRLQANREAEETEKLAARSEARTAQTRLLQSQLHPHVLFNALNGLAELIRKDPVKAENSVKSLSDLLRRLLVASEEGVVPLESERRMVEDYLDIEAMRLGDRLEIRWDWDGALDGLPVIPMLVQPLVENAIKHGISPHIQGGRLIVRAAGAVEALIVEVRNSGMGLGPRAPGGTGIGMKNLAARLALAYGEKARFTLEEEADWVVARIWISMSELRASEDSDARGAGR